MRDSSAARARGRVVSGCLLLLLALWASSPVAAQSPVVRVEEYWEMVVSEPSAEGEAPQMTFTMSPLGDIGSLHVVFEMNQRTLPGFAPGGLQVQLWNGRTPLEDHAYPSTSRLDLSNEAIAWTQAMDLTGGNLVFEVITGSSTTWGQFGGQGNLKITYPTAIANLDGYRAEVSVANSAVTYAANRMKSLALTKVRKVHADGQEEWDLTPRVLIQQP